jgi:hypothetical protein
MWSPEGRRQNARELKSTADKILRYRQLADRFLGYFPPDSDSARSLGQIKRKIEDLRARCLDREKRLAKGVVKIGVVGLEKQGKSAFLSAWLKSEKLLPSEAERCTWSTTVVEPGEEGKFEATVHFYGPEEFKQRIASYFDALEPGSADRWEGLNEAEIARMKATFRAREGYDVDDPDRSGRKEQAALVELQEIAATLPHIKQNLGKSPLVLPAKSLDELADLIRPYIALKDTKNGNRPYGGVRAVKIVSVNIPVQGAMPGVVLVDLPGIDAPSDKAARHRRGAHQRGRRHDLREGRDPPLAGPQRDRAAAHRSERRPEHQPQGPDVRRPHQGRPLRSPGRERNWHWQLATRNFKAHGVDRVFPYSKLWVHKGPDLSHPVAPADGLLRVDRAGQRARDAAGRRPSATSTPTSRCSIKKVMSRSGPSSSSSRPSSEACWWP